MDSSLAELGSITLKVVTDKAEVTLWNEYVDRHHYLSYKHPIGAALKYFIMSDHPQPQVLGCLLFSASVWHLADRDQRMRTIDQAVLSQSGSHPCTSISERF
ncbi:Druantia anti-phage system protein DruA [Bathymodiolus platifrons methanotrophic gill symbiont]|uniref:Druantia anti-phage system protein DruA n=1 Tax=Bathymodiolus platifrons methanotrophic gill symbiont TaxID=113268 RepID=UPI001E5D4433|nr:Druantia anti-phage system protein DruA [Bathymodiolus platifrons methanotrophic gill symbiont]